MWLTRDWLPSGQKKKNSIRGRRRRAGLSMNHCNWQRMMALCWKQTAEEENSERDEREDHHCPTTPRSLASTFSQLDHGWHFKWHEELHMNSEHIETKAGFQTCSSGLPRPLVHPHGIGPDPVYVLLCTLCNFDRSDWLYFNHSDHLDQKL